MPKLKPCPFCGSKAKLIRIDLGEKTRFYTTVCLGDRCVGNYNGVHDTQQKAVAAWNRRAKEETP